MSKTATHDLEANRWSLDLHSILVDLRRYLVAILLSSFAIMGIIYAVSLWTTVPEYVSKAMVMVVQNEQSEKDYRYATMVAVTTQFAQIMNSAVMQQTVCEELGLEEFPKHASISVVPVEDTQLLDVRVTANEPYLSYEIMRSMLTSYPDITEYIIADFHLNILEEPKVPTVDASEVNRATVLWLGWGIGCLTAFFCVILLSVFRDTVKNAKEAPRKVDAHFLGSIAHEKKYKSLQAFFHRRAVPLFITNPLLSAQYQESFHLVSVKLKQRLDRKNKKVLAVTSVMENEGKSTVSANLALELSRFGKRVLLIDADLRRPALYKLLGIQPDSVVNLGDVLQTGGLPQHLISRFPHSDLLMILNTKPYEESSELLSSGHMKELLTLLRPKMDYIILDLPPVSLTSDAESISDLCDGCLLVVRQDYVPTREINDAIDALHHSGNPVLGFVLNNATVLPWESSQKKKTRASDEYIVKLDG